MRNPERARELNEKADRRAKEHPDEDPLTPQEVDELMEAMGVATSQAPLEVMSLAAYRDVFHGSPPPTHEQCEAFAGYVAGAHSWYKHLPFWTAGVPFTFFLDPSAGLMRAHMPDGAVVLGMRREGFQAFHYAELPSDTYRARFGLLAFSAAAGSDIRFAVGVHRPNGTDAEGYLSTKEDDTIALSPDGLPYRLPPEVREAGTALVGACIHERCDVPEVFHAWLQVAPDPVPWPESSGGPGAIAALRRRLDALDEAARAGDEAARSAWREPDRGIARVLEPERDLFRNRMIEAMFRVVALVYE